VRISYGNSVRLFVRPFVCPSQLGTVSRPVEIGTLGFHLMSLVLSDEILCHWVKGVPTNEGRKRGTPPRKTLFYCYWLV